MRARPTQAGGSKSPSLHPRGLAHGASTRPPARTDRGDHPSRKQTPVLRPFALPPHPPSCLNRSYNHRPGPVYHHHPHRSHIYDSATPHRPPTPITAVFMARIVHAATQSARTSNWHQLLPPPRASPARIGPAPHPAPRTHPRKISVPAFTQAVRRPGPVAREPPCAEGWRPGQGQMHAGAAFFSS